MTNDAMVPQAYVTILQERLLELEVALERDSWIQIVGGNIQQTEFTRDGIQRIVELARLNYLKNPLIKRGVDVQTFYVFGRGVSISAKDSEINEVVQAFLDDQHNQRELTSQQARKAKDKELRIDGNLFFMLFVRPDNGLVRISKISTDEITDIVRDPDNRNNIWYYLRQWSITEINFDTGNQTTKTQRRYYRDFRYQNTTRQTIGGTPIDPTTLIYHVKVGAFSDWAFGVSEIYAALDWAKAYKSFLEDFAKIIKSLARFAWRKKVSGGARGVAAAKARLNSTYGQAGNNVETNPSPVAGSVLVQSENDGDLDPIKTQGSTTSADEGKAIRIMAGIAMGLPDNIASGDVDQGSRATAKSLDRPTEFQFADRQELWIGVFQTLLNFVIYNAVATPQGALRGLGTIETNDYGEQVVIWPDEVDTTIQVDFPPLLEADQLAQIQALVTGATFDGKQPSVISDVKLLARQVLIILGFDDVDQLLDSMYPVDQEIVVTPQLQAVNESLKQLIEVLHQSETS